MKKYLLTISAIILLVAASCQQKTELTDELKATIEKEVIEFNQSSFDAFNKIDFTSWKNYFSDSPDFRAISIDGSILDYEQQIIDSKGLFESVSNLHLTKLSEYNNILTSDLVITTFQISVDGTLKTGENLKVEKLTISAVLKKTNDIWGAIFYQDSGLPPVVTQTEKE